ncbi:MAG: hypothetical protein A2X67_03890 [Ignavibacteria bacterium GWA2_55_11]|nr:MAG: hypothetical protein A2X67_03890 [Ignavibacteria bacterium GWA2_55_11]OGU63612.1 MAG: hypothetical protein A3C56_12110 [Ignavibacteria bacterium RIFCSPHIGHO2_02_FULL_56_12]OGU74585.1 MAG: hypothetical protein A3G43_13255 [Ignavibacteria bacterium RIFCSPLOWO2_12_FULL_56_21]
MRSSSVKLDSVSKRFNRRTIFEKVSASVNAPGSLAITGRNGSGKSTLVKILAGVLSATEGKVSLTVDGHEIPRELLYQQVGFVSPYLMLYDEFSAAENIRLLESMRSGRRAADTEIDSLLDMVGLAHRRNDRIGTFSSGMKQRAKYAVALIHRPAMLILDEPTSNLDAEGIAIVRGVAERQSTSGILIVATNDSEEAGWCSQQIPLGIG